MKRKLSHFFNSLWYEKPSHSLLTFLFLPFSMFYRGVMRLRRFFYQRGIFKTTHFPVPVIVVGNITVGGTGKTPLVIALARALTEKGYRVGIVSRGYGGKKSSLPRHVSSAADPEEVGDEAILLTQKTECPVIVGVTRVEAVKKLLNEFNVNLIISDDGLQHYALGRTLEIAVMDGMRRLGNEHCLPAGPLREPASRLKTVNYVVVNSGQPLGHEYGMTLVPEAICSLIDPSQKVQVEDLSQGPVHAVAGIGNPDRFFKSLLEMGLTIIPHVYPDHHRFCLADIDFGEGHVVMTEKDAVKCLTFSDWRHTFLPVEAKLDSHFFRELYEDLRSG